MKNLCFSLIVIAAFVLFVPLPASGLAPTPDREIDAAPAMDVLSRLNGGGGLDKKPGVASEGSPGMRQKNWFHALSVCYRINAGSRKGWHRVEDLTGFVNHTRLNLALPSGLWILQPASHGAVSRATGPGGLIVLCARWTKIP
jgi:hypothetical protein